MKFNTFKLTSLALTMATAFTAVASPEYSLKDFSEVNLNKTGLLVTSKHGSNEILQAASNGETVYYLTAFTPEQGEELWYVDGENNAVLFADINPGPLSSNPQNLAKYANQVFFTAEHKDTGRELYYREGDQALLVADLNPDGDSDPEYLTAHNDRMYFVADNGNGLEVYRTNGQNTFQLSAFADEGGASSITNLTPFGDWLYLTATTEAKGTEIYRTNGEVFEQYAELGQDSKDGTPSNSALFVYEDKLIFNGYFNDAEGFDLHYIPADHSNPVFMANLVPGADSLHRITKMAVGGDGLLNIFIEANGTKSFYQYDGQNQPIKRAEGNSLRYFASFDDGVFINLDTGSGVELFKYTVGPGLDYVGGLNGDTEINDTQEGSFAHNPVILGNHLYFQAETTDDGVEVLRLEAGANNVEMVYDSIPGKYYEPSSLLFAKSGYVMMQNGFNFRLKAISHNNQEVSDVTPQMQTGVDSSLSEATHEKAIEYNGYYYFTAYTEETGFELYKSNGETTEPVMDIAMGKLNAVPSDLVVYKDELYFAASEIATGRELWKTNGEITQRVTDIIVGEESSDPTYLTVHNGALYFRAKSPNNGIEIFKSDGDSVKRVTDINPLIEDSNPLYLTSFNNRLWFSAKDSNNDFELWYLDDNEQAIKQDLNPGLPASRPSDFVVAGEYMYFTATTADEGKELWVTDGNNPATIADDILEGTGSSAPKDFVLDSDNRLYFIANTELGLRAFIANTGSVNQLNAPEIGFHDIAIVNDRLYALASNKDHGKELWGRVGNNFTLLHDLIEGSGSEIEQIKEHNNGLIGTGLYSSYQLNIANHAEAQWEPLEHENGDFARLYLPHSTAFGKNLIIMGCNNKNGCENMAIYVNQLPTAIPQLANGQYHSGDLVEIDGSNSFDNDGEVVSYFWEQIGGSEVVITDPTAKVFEAIAPNVNGSVQYSIQLTVTDNDGAQKSASTSFWSNNEAPVAMIEISNATPDEGDTVTLDGSGSTDDTVIGTYLWEQVSGPAMALITPDSASTDFVAANVDADQKAEFKLTVTDENEISSSVIVEVEIKNVATTNPTPAPTPVQPPTTSSGGGSTNFILILALLGICMGRRRF